MARGNGPEAAEADHHILVKREKINALKMPQLESEQQRLASSHRQHLGDFKRILALEPKEQRTQSSHLNARRRERISNILKAILH